MSNFLFWYDVLLRMLYYFAVLKQYRNQKLRIISNTCKHLVLLELYTLDSVRCPALEDAGI